MPLLSMAEEQALTEQLLAFSHVQTQDALTRIANYNDPNLIQRFEKPLCIVEALHEEEELQEQARSLLQIILTAEQQKNYSQGFAILQQIRTLTPWDQEEIAAYPKYFEQFVQIKAHFDETIIGAHIYLEQYLDLGRKLYMICKMPKEASLCFKSILALRPNHAETLYAQGRIEEYYENWLPARQYYARCTEIEPDHLYANLQLGYLLVKEGKDLDAAVEHYERVIELDPYLQEAYVRLGEVLFMQEDIERCRQYIEVALSINEYNEAALDLLAKIYRKIEKDFDKAIETYQKGIDHHVHEDSGLLLGALAEMYIEDLQAHEKGKLFYEKSLAADPKQKERTQKFIQLLLTHYQDYGAVVDIYERYLRLVPHDAQMHRAYADFLLDYIHDTYTAKQHFQKALDLKPEWLEIKELLINLPDDEED